MSRRFRIAVAAYPPEALPDRAAYAAKLRGWAEEAASAGAKLMVFPEYAGQELAALAGPTIAADPRAQVDPMTELLAEFDMLHRELASRLGAHILAGSATARREDGAVVNRARLFTPEGGVGVQDKLMPTPRERAVLGVSAGDRARVFDTALGRIGVAICYDAEFPAFARAMAEAGAELILTPSCTRAPAGYWRVRIGAQARALENQCWVAHAPTVGLTPWSGVCEEHHGAGGVYGPPDLGFAPDGVMALGAFDRPGWVYAELEMDLVAEARRHGAVRGFEHWPEQAARLESGVDLVALGGKGAA